MKKLCREITLFCFTILCCSIYQVSAQGLAINDTGNDPDISAMLDISSTKSGLLIPRMTTAQRDSIPNPRNGLQIFNTITSTVDTYRLNHWESSSYTQPASNLVYVDSLNDLPAPVSGAITLSASKMYIFSGFVNISPYYLNLNGAGLRGTDPGKDGIMSSVSGGILRSVGVSVFMQDLAVVPLSGATKAYDMADATGLKYCNLFSGCSVVEVGVPSLGVGQISGFRGITIEKNYWNCKDGIKVAGNVGKFAAILNLITGITDGYGIEFLQGLIIDDVDLSNNYFKYTGQTGIKINAGATVDRGRMTTNLFRGVGTYLVGFDSYSPEWDMRQNTFIPDSRSFGSTFMSSNSTATSLPVVGTYYKVAGTTTEGTHQRFTISNNRLTYIGKLAITGAVTAIVGARSPTNSADFTIVISKNGVVIPNPSGSMAPSTNNQSFQIMLVTEVEMNPSDYIEIFIRSNNGNSTSIVIDNIQFRVSD